MAIDKPRDVCFRCTERGQGSLTYNAIHDRIYLRVHLVPRFDQVGPTNTTAGVTFPQCPNHPPNLLQS
ncbi:MAG: hypothetical protein OXH09_23505, partial [Gammaproteobacteria bacterium]|nr:hypothetical protein [Gammaproteobacteria bacterium]